MQQKGFFAALFDLSFSSFITIRLVQILYLVSFVVIGLGVLVIVISAFAADSAAGVVALIFSPVIFLVLAIFARVYLETIIVLFRIADNTSVMAQGYRR